MPRLFRPCVAEGEDAAQYAGAWVRFYYPTGTDIGAVCAANGWAVKPPEDVTVFAEDGSVIQEAPAPAKAAKKETPETP